MAFGTKGALTCVLLGEFCGHCECLEVKQRGEEKQANASGWGEEETKVWLIWLCRMLHVLAFILNLRNSEMIYRKAIVKLA
jgi:hypothetical protein